MGLFFLYSCRLCPGIPWSLLESNQMVIVQMHPKFSPKILFGLFHIHPPYWKQLNNELSFGICTLTRNCIAVFGKTMVLINRTIFKDKRQS